MSSAANQTADAFIRLPPTVLDAFIPGYSFLATILLEFGVDVSLFVSCFVLGAAAWTAFRFAVVPFGDFFVSALSSSVIVQDYDPIYTHVLNWASVKKSLQHIRALRAHSPGQYYEDFDDANEEDSQQLLVQESLSEDAIFNFNDWSARAPPKFQPHSSSGYFFHRGRLFRLHRNRERVAGEYSGVVYDREHLSITVIWLSPQPIKKLIEEAREFHLSRQTSTTCIKRPTPKSQRSGRRHAWNTIAVRPSRSMATVVLDNEQKARILRDLNDFLHPRTARWYSNRGIPYRRGYLFHGPPGTGKTSLSFALAGVFGLDIYCLALSEATLTEEDLILLFNSLPKRCILLLEDIDSAGVGMTRGEEGDQKQKSSKSKKSSKKASKKASQKKNKRSKEQDNDGQKKEGKTKDEKANKDGVASAALPAGPILKNSITMSGLLNAIDGVASQEGRLLIMTTNYIDRISEALVRPGRVDLSIKFDLANRQQIRDLFLRMYCADSINITRLPTKISQILPDIAVAQDLQQQAQEQACTAHTTPGSGTYGSSVIVSGGDAEKGHGSATRQPLLSDFDMLSSGDRNSDPDAISILAEKFADTLPELAFSPAEIQGFLLVRKKCPAQAVADVAAWKDEEMMKKKKKKKESGSDGKETRPNATANGHVAVPSTNAGEGEKADTIKENMTKDGEVARPSGGDNTTTPNGLKGGNVDGVENKPSSGSDVPVDGSSAQVQVNGIKPAEAGLKGEGGDGSSMATAAGETNGETNGAGASGGGEANASSSGRDNDDKADNTDKRNNDDVGSDDDGDDDDDEEDGEGEDGSDGSSTAGTTSSSVLPDEEPAGGDHEEESYTDSDDYSD